MNKLFKLLEGNGLLILAWILTIIWFVYSTSLAEGRTITTELDHEAYSGIVISNAFLLFLLFVITLVNIFTEDVEVRKKHAEIILRTIISKQWIIAIFSLLYFIEGYDWFHAVGLAAFIAAIFFIFFLAIPLFYPMDHTRNSRE
jgi:hypothetical protein